MKRGDVYTAIRIYDGEEPDKSRFWRGKKSIQRRASLLVSIPAVCHLPFLVSMHSEVRGEIHLRLGHGRRV